MARERRPDAISTIRRLRVAVFMEGICPSGDGDLPGAGKPFIASATSHGLPRSIDGAMARPLPPEVHRRAVPAAPQEAGGRDRRRAAVRRPRTPAAQTVPEPGPEAT